MKSATNDELNKALYEHKWNADSWVITARILKRASELLFSAHACATAPDVEPSDDFEDTKLNQPATLLYGYAMENAIKACLIKELHLSDKDDKPKGWKQHDLALLVGTLPKHLGIEVTQEHLLLLNTLTSAVIWAGKYPVSLTLAGKTGSFVLQEQYDYVAGVSTNLPPGPLNAQMRVKLDALFENLIEKV